MTPDLILHCGVQKTGSTALHHFLQANQDALRGDLAILTPRKGSALREMGRLAGLFSLGDATEGALVHAIEEIRAEVQSLSVSRVLVSHENLPGAMMGRAGVTTLYPRLDALLALFEAHLAPLHPTYAFYTRDMGGWKRSVHNQAVKSDSYTNPLEEFMHDTADCGAWDTLEQRVSNVLGQKRAHFFALEKEADRTRPGQQLLQLCGVNADQHAALKPLSSARNESLGHGALEFMRLMNGLNLDRPARRSVAQLITQNPTLFAQTRPDTEKGTAPWYN
ncbi:hypothetical protein C1J03_18135 [Sulfitobacter sp. SK012]|uniref:hypothetical protein n=1 Tax=Sulfitobacter sp. SK012 TaxID=1389005 RepID=UPI000E0C56C9|nr:hypothetical protein [Sulfitobacter sp. SK012]AXI47755.1 hypothetical protein C1J03_18135 [Sulfitobacter sp. SK012]